VLPKFNRVHPKANNTTQLPELVLLEETEEPGPCYLMFVVKPKKWCDPMQQIKDTADYAAHWRSLDQREH